MTHPKTIRWKQRFSNFEKAYLLLEEAVSLPSYHSKLEKEGVVQRFEFTFELAWKTLKDFLESQGMTATFPREIIKTSFKTGILSNGELWMTMLESRNLMTHTYNEETFSQIFNDISHHYFPCFKELYLYLKAQ